MDALLYALKHHDEIERARALRDLGDLGQGAYRALSELVATLEDGSAGVRGCALATLVRLERVGLEVAEALRARIAKVAEGAPEGWRLRVAAYAHALEVIELVRSEKG